MIETLNVWRFWAELCIGCARVNLVCLDMYGAALLAALENLEQEEEES